MVVLSFLKQIGGHKNSMSMSTNTSDIWSGHSLGSQTVPIFVQSSQVIDRNAKSNCRMLRLDYPSMHICNFPIEIPARTIQVLLFNLPS